MLDHHASPDQEDEEGYTPIMVAAEQGSVAIFDKLYREGIWNTHTYESELVLKRVRVLHQSSSDGMNALMLAVNAGSLKIVQSVRNIYPDLDLKNKKGHNILLYPGKLMQKCNQNHYFLNFVKVPSLTNN